MRKIVFDVKNVYSTGGRDQQPKVNSDEWTREKRNFALKTINNAKILTEAVTKFKNIAQENPDIALTEAIEKIDSVIEEMRVDFKKHYVL